IDRAVHAVVAQALAVFEVDAESLAALKPDVILTQDLCDVCAVTLADVRAALRRLAGHPVEIVSLSPMRLADVLADVERVGAALGREEPARRLRAGLEARIEGVRRRAANA